VINMPLGLVAPAETAESQRRYLLAPLFLAASALHLARRGWSGGHVYHGEGQAVIVV
jgi:hypothetical protein